MAANAAVVGTLRTVHGERGFDRLMGYAKRTDANHKPIVHALASCGWVCLDLSRAGHGAPDLLAARAGRLVAVEVKDGTKSPSRRQLTPREAEVHRAFEAAGVAIVVVTSIADALALQ